MPALEDALGPGMPARWRGRRHCCVPMPMCLTPWRRRRRPSSAAPAAAAAAGWPADALAALPEAIRHRLLRSAALAAGSPAGALSQRHIASVDELITGWHGQRRR